MVSDRITELESFLIAQFPSPKTLMFVCRNRDTCARVRSELSSRLEGQLKVATLTRVVALNGNTVLLISITNPDAMHGLRAHTVIIDDVILTDRMACELRHRIRP